MLGKGLMSGFEDGSFKATGKTTKAEVATILIRFDEAQKKAPSNFKGLNVLVEVATTGTNMLSATKYTYLDEDTFANVAGKPFTFKRNNSGVDTVERLIFVELEGKNPMNNSIFAKIFVDKGSELGNSNITFQEWSYRYQKFQYKSLKLNN